MAGGQTMTGNNALRAQVKTLVGQFAEVLAPMPVQRCVMLARVGYGPKPRARSVRLPLEELLHVRA